MTAAPLSIVLFLYRYIVWKELAPEETGEEYLTGTTLDLFPNNFTRRAHAPGYPE